MYLNTQDIPKGKILNSVDKNLSNENGNWKRFYNKLQWIIQILIPLSDSYTYEFSACYWSKWLLAASEN